MADSLLNPANLANEYRKLVVNQLEDMGKIVANKELATMAQKSAAIHELDKLIVLDFATILFNDLYKKGVDLSPIVDELQEFGYFNG